MNEQVDLKLDIILSIFSHFNLLLLTHLEQHVEEMPDLYFSFSWKTYTWISLSILHQMCLGLIQIEADARVQISM